jgi:hypothetical protein
VKALAAIAPPKVIPYELSDSESEEEVKAKPKPVRPELLGKALFGYERDIWSIDQSIQSKLNTDIFNCKQRYISLFK